MKCHDSTIQNLTEEMREAGEENDCTIKRLCLEVCWRISKFGAFSYNGQCECDLCLCYPSASVAKECRETEEILNGIAK